jgi:hypothetical protein
MREDLTLSVPDPVSHPALAELERRIRRDPSRTFSRVVTFGRLEIVSFTHSCIYTALLVAAFALHNPQPVTTILGFAHGIIWIGMSLICIAAARLKVIPYWLAVSVAVLGGIGPFFGTFGFIAESRRRALRSRERSSS